eukprot:8165344-Pyramimonas_sp.AAC.1
MIGNAIRGAVASSCAHNSDDRKHGSRGRGLATSPASTGNHGSPLPSEAAPAAVGRGHLPRSMDLAAARQIHGSLIH